MLYIFWFNHFLENRAEIRKRIRWFFEELKTRKKSSEISWPLPMYKFAALVCGMYITTNAWMYLEFINELSIWKLTYLDSFNFLKGLCTMQCTSKHKLQCNWVYDATQWNQNKPCIWLYWRAALHSGSNPRHSSMFQPNIFVDAIVFQWYYVVFGNV